MLNSNSEIPPEAELANAFCNSLNKRIDETGDSGMEEISRQLHISYQTLNNLRNNHKKLPPLNTINKLLNYFGCSFESMLGNTSGKDGLTYLEIFANFKFLLDNDLIKNEDYYIYYEDPLMIPNPDDKLDGRFFQKGIFYDIIMQYHELSRLLSDDLGLLHRWVPRSIERVPDDLFSAGNNRDLKSVISNRIVEISSLRHIKAKDLMDGLKCTQATISQYQTGTRIPSAYKLIKLAHILGTTTDYLLGRSASFWGVISKQQMIQSLFALLDHGAIYCDTVAQDRLATKVIMIKDPILDTFCIRYARYRSTVLALETDVDAKKALLNEWITKNCANYHVPLLDKNNYTDLEVIYQTEYYPDDGHYRLSSDKKNHSPDIFDRLLSCYTKLTTERRHAQYIIKAFLKKREFLDPFPDNFDENFS